MSYVVLRMNGLSRFRNATRRKKGRWKKNGRDLPKVPRQVVGAGRRSCVPTAIVKQQRRAVYRTMMARNYMGSRTCPREEEGGQCRLVRSWKAGVGIRIRRWRVRGTAQGLEQRLAHLVTMYCGCPRKLLIQLRRGEADGGDCRHRHPKRPILVPSQIRQARPPDRR